jgi:hypothetical protein
MLVQYRQPQTHPRLKKIAVVGIVIALLGAGASAGVRCVCGVSKSQFNCRSSGRYGDFILVNRTACRLRQQSHSPLSIAISLRAFA